MTPASAGTCASIGYLDSCCPPGPGVNLKSAKLVMMTLNVAVQQTVMCMVTVAAMSAVLNVTVFIINSAHCMYMILYINVALT